MAYKCKNCGKFVAKNATICKHCGQENPAALEDNNLPAGQIAQARPVNANLPKQIQGIKIAKPFLILGTIYYVFIPFISIINTSSFSF